MCFINVPTRLFLFVLYRPAYCSADINSSMWPVLMFSSLKIPVLNNAVKFCQFSNSLGIQILNNPVLKKGILIKFNLINFLFN